MLGSIYGNIIQLNALWDNRRWERKEMNSQIKGVYEDVHSFEVLNDHVWYDCHHKKRTKSSSSMYFEAVLGVHL